MILTIETNKRSFINAIITLCKSAGILSYKLENTAKNTQTPASIASHQDTDKIEQANENEVFLITELKKRHKENHLDAAISMEDFYKEMAND